MNNELLPGDLIYLAHEKTSFLVHFTPNGSISTHKGEIKFSGELAFGQSIQSSSGETFTILQPSLSDTVMKAKRATTISYPKDIGAVIMETNIYSGAKVLEIGTGSAAFSIAISSILGETGCIYSFERRPEHLEVAMKNFSRLARFENAEFILKDNVAEKGFELDIQVDTAYIDVPDPISLLPHVYTVLKGGGHAAFIMPCTEQLSNIVRELPDAGFTRIRIKELLERGIRPTPGRLRPNDRMIAHTVYLLFAQKGNQYQVMNNRTLRKNNSIAENIN